jgi:hypothetical protein
LYENFNGGYFWNGALLVRAKYGDPRGSPLPVSEWNKPELWKDMYESHCADITFFAEDVFGVQFGIKGERVVQFDPEAAQVADCAESATRWAELVVGDPALYTGYPVLLAWEAEHGRLPRGSRLIPKKLFMLGGDFHSENMVRKVDVEGMRVRAEFWRVLKDVPDGESVVFKVEE